MTKALIITEKPSVARDITEALGGFVGKDGNAYYESDQFVCTYAVGHILGLLEPEDIDPNYKRWRLADLPILPKEFKMKPIEGQEERIKVIQKLIARKDVTELVNACDAAREGELIFREIVKYANSDKTIRRLWLQSMTKQAIIDGFKKLKDGKLYNGLASAAECRAYSDWLIGMNSTRALTVRLKSKSQRGASWSAGRVQTPTLALLVDRELRVLEHSPKPFWKVHAKFQAKDHEYSGTWYDPKFRKSAEDNELREDRIFDQKVADKIVQDVTGVSATASETRRPKTRSAPLLFDLTSAQKEANRRYGWSAKRTLGAAQRCYERHKVLTYPRTSSRVLPEDYRPEVDNIIANFAETKTYGEHARYLINKGRLNEKKIFDNAGVSDHFAIIPTGVVAELDGDDARFFDLVVRTFLAAFYPQAIYEEVERETVVGTYHFKTKPPLILKEPGFLAVFEREKEEDSTKMPALVVGQADVSGVAVESLAGELEASETKPPPRIGEAGLLSMMENAGRQVEDEELAQALQKAEGLGTAATRADIIENLKSKEYVDQALRPTAKGIRLIDILQRIKAERLTSAELTARLELHLSEVEAGKRTSEEYMKEVEQITSDVVVAARDFDYDSIYPDQDPLGECPRCKRAVFERAWFYGCSEATKRDGKKLCEFLIWKEFYGRYLDRETVRTLLRDSKTHELDGFRDPNGQMYKAILTIENGNIVKKNTDMNVDGPVLNIEINPEPLGKCPVHSGQDCMVVETRTEFACQQYKRAKEQGESRPAGFSFPRVLCKREMKREEVIAFLNQGATEVLQKFISKRGRPFSAKLVQQPGGRFTFEFPERKPKSAEAGETTEGGEKVAKPRKAYARKKAKSEDKSGAAPDS
jgi:DNA topoisomerase-3